MYGPEWESICPFTLHPFNDDSDDFYGKGINEYKKELKKMGIVFEVKGIHALLFFVNKGQLIGEADLFTSTSDPYPSIHEMGQF